MVYTISLQLSHPTGLKQKLDRYNWSEVSQHELKGVEMTRRRWKERGTMVPNSEKIAEKVRKKMEVCRSSCRQNLFLDPRALAIKTPAKRSYCARTGMASVRKLTLKMQAKRYHGGPETVRKASNMQNAGKKAPIPVWKGMHLFGN